MKHFFTIATLLLFAVQPIFAQQYHISGSVYHMANEEPFAYSTVLLLNATDSLLAHETLTHADGTFTFEDVEAGEYVLRAQHLGYENNDRAISVTEDIQVGSLYLREGTQLLDAVTITMRPPVGEQRGDTTQFNAGAFQTMKDATAQSLIEKMPGMGSEGGTLQAQGENIVQILVDGKPFFGTDVNAALQNLPAEIIQSVQVFDKLSDRAELSGFDDGEREKTINIITKPNSRQGLFGKASAGYGTNERYIAGASVNAFNEDQRLTVTGLTNNINAVDYSSDPNSQGEFLPQNGIINTNRIGLNYTDSWGKKININTSYLFSHRKNVGESSLLREYILPDDEGQYYTESSNNTRRNMDHRVDMRLEYHIDSNNRILFRPNFSARFDKVMSFFAGNTVSDTGPVNQTENHRLANNSDIDLNTRLHYTRRFRKPGRSLRLGLETGNHWNDDDADRRANNVFYDDTERIETINQNIVRMRRGLSWEASMAFTESISKHSMMELEYEISNRINDSDQLTYETDDTGERLRIDTALSNMFDSEYLRQEAEIGYQYGHEKVRLQVEAAYQHAQLNNNQEFPSPYHLQRTFQSVMPSVRFNYRFTDSKNLQFDYDTRTHAPSVGDLQAVINNTNPLHLRTGNPDLDQSYSNRFRLNYRMYDPQSQRSFFAQIRSSQTSDMVVNSTLVADEPIELSDGIVLERGAQLTRPINLDGYWDLNSYFHYGMPVRLIPSNLNVHGGVQYSHRPGMVNEQVNTVNSTRYSGGLSLSSNISDRIDFNVWTRSSFNSVQNSLRPTLDNDYFTQTTRLNYNWILWQNLVYRLDVHHRFNSGLPEGFDNSTFMVNMAVGKKFLRNERAEISVNAYDLFDQNNDIHRNITEMYIQDSQSNVMQRFFMLSFTYNIRHFSRGTTERDYQDLYH